MSSSDLVDFMLTPNCDEIFDAIFQKRSLSDWRGTKRFELLNARIADRSIQINISSGPSDDYLHDLFEKRKKLHPAEQGKIMDSIYDKDLPIKDFMDALLPGRNVKEKGIMPIEIRQCVLPDIHNNPEIAFALANGVNQTAFDHPGARALVMHRWRQAKSWYRANLLNNLLLALSFLIASFLINELDWRGHHREAYKWERYALASFAFMLWIRNIFNEIMQMVGLAMMSHFREVYCSEVGNVMDIIRLVLTGFGIVMIIAADHYGVADDMNWYRIFLAVVMFLLWLKVLYCQRGFDSMGMYMLPILVAVRSTWNFILVMIWPAIGFANCYFMLNVYPEFFRAVTLVYRMGFVGDFDVEEVEDIDPEYVPKEDGDGTLEVDDPKWTTYHAVFIIFTFVVTLSFAIVMMNIFIGVVGEAYNTAYSNRTRIFLHNRACIGFEHLAVQTAFDRFFGGLSAVTCTRRRSDITINDGSQRFLWYSRPKNMEELGLPDDDDDENNADNTHDLIKNVMNEVLELKTLITAKQQEEDESNNVPRSSRRDKMR